MPMYEFQCTQCEERFEDLVRNAEEEAEVVCPSCDSDKIFRVLSTFAVHCGGSGKHAVPSSSFPGGGGCGSGGFS
jgi:putative FmdB family regulatory protein